MEMSHVITTGPAEVTVNEVDADILRPREERRIRIVDGDVTTFITRGDARQLAFELLTICGREERTDAEILTAEEVMDREG